MVHNIKNIISVEPYKITLEFDCGEIKCIDIEPKLIEWSQTPDSKFKQLLKRDYFKTVKINQELAAIYWDNGIDFCPDVLYSLSK